MTKPLRVDKNQAEIVAALRKIGALVWSIGQPFDLLVRYRGQWHVFEIKNRAGRNRITQAQNAALQALYANEGHLQSVPIIYTVDEAMKCIGAISRAAA